MVHRLAPRATALALVLLAAPACRGCLVDDPTYAGGGGAGSTSNATTTSSTAGPGSTGSTGGNGGAGATGSSSASVGGGGTGGAGGEGSSSASAGGNGAGGSGSGGAPAGCPRDDDFDEGIVFDEDDGDVTCWSLMNNEGGEEPYAEVAFEGGAVRLTPAVGTGWFDADRGVFIHQEVTGDFTATLSVDTETTVGGEYQLAGFLLRDPASPPESWIKAEVGKNMTTDTSDYIGLTVNSDTVIAGNSSDEIGDATLGVCRRGDAFYVARYVASTWELLLGGAPLTPGGGVPDLPATIQLGFNAAADGESFDALIDDFRFTSGSDDCLTTLEALWPTR